MKKTIVMKKKFLILAFFGIISSCFCQEIFYEVKADTGLFENDEYSLFKIEVQEHRGLIRTMKKGEKVKYTFGDPYSIGDRVEGDPLSHIVATDQNGIKGKVAWADLFLPSNDSLPDDIKTNDEKERWISAYCYEILSSNAKETIFRYESYWKNEWYSSVGEEWHEDIRPSNFMIFDNAIDILGYDSSRGILLITSSEKVKDGIKIGLFIKYKIDTSSKDIFLHHFKKGEQEMTLKIDGDYLEMYLDGSKSPLMVFARTNNYKVITEKLRTIARGEKADLSDVTWPRHADGSCDYDDKIIKTHKVGGMYKTEDSLRLRAAEGTTGDALATLAAGTRVKVEITGKEETIDGITSNWMQVEVLDGAKDKDGNAIEMGTTGWLFGGYLSTTEYVEPVKEEKKLNLLDSVETKDERKVNRAAKMNKKEENDDFVFPFIQVGFGIILIIVLLPIILVIAKRRKTGKK
ncbi:MAG: SH3 domain-containing protein [Treponemataceae bacterium]|nr:SH3 domain-containing protein [Treponemataceae bacterium]